MNDLSLPGILKIGFLECSKLSPQLTLKSLSDVPIAVFSEIIYVNFYGEPTCDAVNNNDCNGRVEKSTLKFITTDKIPDNKPLAFVVHCVNGAKYLIGTKEPPYPVVKISTETGKTGGDASAYSVEITYSSIKSLLSVAV